MKAFDNILETIGNTPLIRLNKIAEDIPGSVYAKVEYFNPGHSVKDRMALKMIEDAEKDGRLQPGGTIIECTSGNTGMGLALAAIVKGYKLICTLNDKQSKEKMDVLRAMGAQLHVCPTNVAPDHPESYYSVARKLNEEIPNSFFPNQYDNLSNRQAHYESTGPEIWEQTEGKITHFVVGVGTGGTISGVARYLKEKNPDIQIWGIDSYGSVFKKYHETREFDESEIYSYITEGIGEDILPANVDFDLIDRFEKVSDQDGALACRELALKEGLLIGYSCGSAFQGLRQLKDELSEDDLAVVLFHDHGSRYIGKVYNDDWMRERGFLPQDSDTAADLVRKHLDHPLITVGVGEPVSNAIQLMRKFSISQIPVHNEGEMAGVLNDSRILREMNAENLHSPCSELMDPPLPVVKGQASKEEVAQLLKKDHAAVLVDLGGGTHHILTRHDLISALA